MDTVKRPPRELSRFSAGGKTFFFNKGSSKEGAAYLAINALYGQGQQQRLVLFESQFLPFFKHAREAIEQVAGISFGSVPSAPALPEPPQAAIPESCPAGHGYHCFRVYKDRHAVMKITCDSCGSEVW